jgi:subfamily B ATP-binding cassette protein MsbA
MTFGFSTEATAVLRRLLGYVRPYRAILIPAALAIVLYALATGALPFFVEDVFQQFEDELLADAEAATSLYDALRLPVLIVAIFALRGAMNFLTVYGLSWVGRSAIRDLRRDLFRHYLYLPAGYYDRHATGDLLSRLTFNTEQVAEAISTSLVTLVRDCLLIVVMLGVMWHFSKELTLTLAVVGPVIALLLGAMSRAFRRYSTRIQNSMGDVTRVAAQALRGQRVIKVFSGQEYEAARFGEINGRNFRLHLRLVATRAFGDGLTQFIVVFGVAVVGFLVLSGWLDQEIGSPVFTGFITAVGILLTSLKRIVGTNAALQRGIAAAESLFEILDEPAEAAQAGAAATAGESATAGEGSAHATGAVEFDAVSFRYGEGQDEVLHDIRFRLEPGETLAVVGRSGSGKSTLVSLLPRFYDVTGGTVRLDGRDIRDYPLQELRRQFSFVSQDVVLFDDTIAGNIAYGALAEAPREQIERAAEVAYVNHFASDLPRGLDTPVGEAGALLSGGQRQRIAIARAVLKDAPILILDEATSALDSESERHVQSALTGLMRGRTTLVIAHRLSTVEQADRILVMRDGRVVESGTHRELLAAGGHYATLYQLQFAD